VTRQTAVWPRIVFVLGKGGVGRSTVAAALGTCFAGRGEKVLIVEWTVAEAIAPWFGLPPAGYDVCEVAPRLAVTNFRLDLALRDYFVGHLGLDLLYRRVISGKHVRRLIEAAPGISELLFLGELFWLTTLAEAEAGLHFDRIVVDAPATGHGASLLDLPATIRTIGTSGLLALETRRVVKMMSDPEQVGVVVVALPEELAVEETLELIPRAYRDLARPPIAAVVNRSVARFVTPGSLPIAAGAIASSLTPGAREGLEVLYESLVRRAEIEGSLRRSLEGSTVLGTCALEEQLAVSDDVSPAAVVRALSSSLGLQLGGLA
jgi:hypothetical protein